MNNFQHFLVTRMNVDENLITLHSQEERNNRDFLEDRFDTFEKTCYPSVRAQISPNFIWLILCDADLPHQFRERIDNYHSDLKILPVYTVFKYAPAQVPREQIRQIITTPMWLMKAVDSN